GRSCARKSARCAVHTTARCRTTNWQTSGTIAWRLAAIGIAAGSSLMPPWISHRLRFRNCSSACPSAPWPHQDKALAGATRHATSFKGGNLPMSQTPGVPFHLLRGGTSKGVFFDRAAVPSDRDELAAFLLNVFGSPDPRQIDGLGGGDKLTSKAAV